MSETTQETSDLAYTRDIRRSIVDKQMAPDNKEGCDYKIVLQALDGLDRQTLTKMKIKSDEGMNSSAAMAVGALANIFLDPRSKKMEQALETVRTVPELPSDLPMPEFLPSEMDASGNQENYDMFIQRMNQEGHNAG